MTETEIMKALECCGVKHYCKECVFRTNSAICVNALIENALALINRKNAEIEKLTINMNAFGLGMKREKERADTARAEAIKEFVERVKQLNQKSLIIWNCQIDQIAKEMGVE